MVFQKWSEIDSKAKRELRPDLGLKNWDGFDEDEKYIVLRHIINNGWFAEDTTTYKCMSRFAEDYKAKNMCPALLEHGGPHLYESSGYQIFDSSLKECCKKAAVKDALHILAKGTRDAAYEVISYYSEETQNEPYDKEKFDRFSNCFNDIAEQFGIDIILTSTGMAPRQEPKIAKVLYEPTLQQLSDPKWESVSRDLGDAFEDYHKGTKEGYSSAITHTVSALQGFLQIVMTGQTGKGDLKALLAEALAKNKIPNDAFSQKILKDIESVLMQERQGKGDPHPKKEYADEKTALLVLNIAMIFIQHCLR